MGAAKGLFRIPRRSIVIVVVLGIGQVITLVSFVLLLRSVVNALVPAVVGEAAEAAFRVALGEVALLGVVALVHGWLRSREFSVTEAVGYRIVRDLRMKMYRHLQGMTPRQLQGRARGGLLLRFLGDLSMTRMWISHGILGGIMAAVVLVGTLGVLMFLSSWMTLAILAALCTGAALSLAAGRAMRRATRAMRRRRSLVMSNIDEQLNAHAVVQVFGRSAGEFARLSRQNDALTRALIRVARLRGYLRGISTAFSLIVVGVVLTVGMFEIRRGTASVGLVVAFVVVARQLSGPVHRLGLAHDYWHRAQVSEQKIAEYLRSSSRPIDRLSLERMRVRKGDIRFDSVTVSGALHDIVLHVEPGQLVAVTGPGGAGKSTLLGLLARMVEPTEGSVIVDGQPLAQTIPDSVARRVGVVGPDLPLMRGTVRRNITYALPDADDDEVERVVRASGLDDVLAELPDGINTWVTEGGRNLSVSQRQRIALARALMGNPPILVLDEPTDGLDRSGKDAFIALLRRHAGTAVLATHDPQEIALADAVVVMAGGRVTQVLSGDEYRDQLWLAERKGAPWKPALVS
ncbi:ABC transporter ATP-binding protein [Cryobacterium tepidiphilum]|uniref:ABC transporter ATP-binding protein n=1 Tax=Cryobacterium tepidiphilum TaxID=2486026 RepID=A0A3M8LP11_9MICO|nr:ABC transporter ATP-binding protein [Cryobacterium tepidiphilum]RNE66454.1 ABC transporter ATP-binding protein [Cryobacterium tepidiphilum]